MMSGIRIPNSLAWSPDGRTMYFADSHLYSIFAFDFDTSSGEIGDKRVFATTRAPGFPGRLRGRRGGVPVERRVQHRAHRQVRA